ncbi:MAG: TRIC cation channel family protein, partial [Vicinamibacterales bacterium]
MYFVELIGTAIFAITGVLAVTRRGLDVVGALMLGVVTALGGGTVRDALIGAPIFWFGDLNYVWAAIVGALAAFWIGAIFRSTFRALLYLDGLGAALFAIAAAHKVLLMHYPGAVAVMMGVLTGIGGGLLRDVLAGRPTLLISREIYATPILLGCTAFVAAQWIPEARGYA